MLKCIILLAILAIVLINPIVISFRADGKIYGLSLLEYTYYSIYSFIFKHKSVELRTELHEQFKDAVKLERNCDFLRDELKSFELCIRSKNGIFCKKYCILGSCTIEYCRDSKVTFFVVDYYVPEFAEGLSGEYWKIAKGIKEGEIIVYPPWKIYFVRRLFS